MLSIIADSKSEELQNKLLHHIETEINSKISREKLLVFKDSRQRALYLIEDNNDNINVKEIIAEVIADFIIDFYEIKLMLRILRSPRFDFINDHAKKIIIDRTKQYIKVRNVKSDLFNDHKNRIIIRQKLLEYIEESDEIAVEGFVNFRLGEYRQELENYIQMTLEEIFLEEQNKEFVNFLKYFISVQPSKEGLIHVVRVGHHQYKLFNILEQDVTRNYFEDVFIDNDIDCDDMLISALINICPVRIIFHELNSVKIENSKMNDQIIDLIFQIFDTRLLICHTCSFCAKLRSALELDDNI